MLLKNPAHGAGVSRGNAPNLSRASRTANTNDDPGVPLTKPRFTPGYILWPASRAGYFIFAVT